MAISVAVCFLLTMSTALAVPVDEDEAIDLQGDMARYLSDLEDAKSRYYSYDDISTRSEDDFPSWSQWRARYPNLPVDTMELSGRTPWINYVSAMNNRGYFIVPFFANGEDMDYEDLRREYPATGQHMIVFPLDTDYLFFYDVVVKSDTTPTIPPSSGTTTTRPSGGINITINNTNVNINGTNTSISTDIAGLVRLAQALNGSRPLSSVEVAAWDFNRNGYIDITDLVIMASLLH